jgi:hypothetical protein
LPLETTEVAPKLNWSAAATAVAEERSFTVPVGLDPSYFTRSRRKPSSRASRGQSRRGLPPSPRLTRWAGSAIGRTAA